jgi:hypothetical protein
MRRIAFAVAAASTALLVVVGASGAAADDGVFVSLSSAAASGAQLLPNDQGADIYGVGGGKAFNGLQKFSFSAHEGPNGDFGQVGVSYYDPLGNLIVSYSVDVTCVNIHSLAPDLPFDRGVIRGVIKKITPVPNLLMLDVGDTVDFGIKDGGNQSSSTPVDDFFAPSSQGVPPTASCKAFVYDGNLNNVTQGNVNIKLG